MKKLRILSLFLALLMVAALFTACKEEEAPPPAEEPEVVLDLTVDNTTEYVIVYDYKASEQVTTTVDILVGAFAEYLGVTIEKQVCFSDIEEEETDIPSEKEILVGMTNREESIEALSGLRTNDYVIGAYGTKMVIGSVSDAGTQNALTAFLSGVVYEQGDKFGILAGGKFSCSFSSKNNIHYEGTYSYKTCTMADARIDSYALIYADSSNTLAASTKALATDIQAQIFREAGYELPVLSDTRYYADYMILVGPTCRSDEDLLDLDLDDDEYYLKLYKTTVIDPDGNEKEGAILQILFGKNAQKAAFDAFKKEFVSTSTTPIDGAFGETTVTNMG